MIEAKILLDSCVWAGTKNPLIEAGCDVVWVGDFLKDPGDEAIIRFAYKEKRILITLDKDFGELAVFRREPHCGIIRIVDHSATELGSVSRQILEKYRSELINSAIITVDKQKVRIRLDE
jgi:predicted nuclease of predicted toxin-antitoxin system